MTAMDPFDEMMRRVTEEGDPQYIDRHGVPVAVILPYDEYLRLRSLTGVKGLP